MSRLNAREAHTAGPSWRKWESPAIVTPVKPWSEVLVFWLDCALLGAAAGVIALAAKGWL